MTSRVRRAAGTVVGDDREHRSTADQRDPRRRDRRGAGSDRSGARAGQQSRRGVERRGRRPAARRPHAAHGRARPNRSEHLHRRVLSIPVPVEELFAWHEREGALDRLLPPWKRVPGRRAQRHDPRRRPGPPAHRRRPGCPIDWVAEHTGFVRNEQFVDRMVSGPVRTLGAHPPLPRRRTSDSVVEDTVEYEAPFGPLGELRRAPSPAADVRLPPSAHARRPRPPVAVRRRSADAHRCHRVERADRSRARAVPHDGRAPRRSARAPAGQRPGRDLLGPATGLLDTERLEGVDAVVHLAGESIRPPWTRSRRQRIRESRSTARCC